MYALAEATNAPSEQEPLARGWERLLKKYFRPKVNEAVLGWPERRSVEVSFHALERHDRAMAEHLVRHPYESLRAAEEALKSLDVPDIPAGGRPRLQARISMRSVDLAGTPEDPLLVETPIVKPSELTRSPLPPRAERIGTLVTLRGRVMRLDQATSFVEEATFQCRRCGCFIRHAQDDPFLLENPLDCDESQGGCGRDSSFKLVVDETRGQKTRHITVQKLVIEPAYDAMTAGAVTSAKVEVWAREDLVETVQESITVGEVVYVTGIMRTTPRTKGNAKSRLSHDYIEASTIEREHPESTRPTMTDEEKARLQGLLLMPEYFEELCALTAPHIVDTPSARLAKRVLLLAHVGGLRGKKRARHQVHVLLAGDASTSKTLIARWFAKLASRVVHVNGRDATVPGLTMSREQQKDEVPYLAPGAMLLASGGEMLFDEAQDADAEVLAALKEGMESQTLTKTVGGGQAHVAIDLRVVMLMNPPAGKFFTDGHETFLEQLELMPALQSRFDAIIPFLDERHKERDAAIIGSIADRHWGEDDEDSGLDEERANIAFLRKLLHLASEHEPAIPKDVRDYAKARADELRDGGKKGGEKQPPAAFRQVESVFRFATAHAKIHFRESMLPADVDAAMDITRAWSSMCLGSEGDWETFNNGRSAATAAYMTTVFRLLAEMSAGTDGVPEEDLLLALPKEDRDMDRLQKALRELKRTNKAYSPRPGVWRRA